MKKKLIPLLGIMVVVALVGAIIISLMEQRDKGLTGQEDVKIRIVSSFYPSYIVAVNITDQIEGIQVESLANMDIGCLHDYRLTTSDMKKLSDADVLLINGGGMENYLSDVLDNYPQLAIINLSEGIPMIASTGHEGEVNPHVWLDPKRYIAQLKNAEEGLAAYIDGRDGLSEAYKKDAKDKLSANSAAYIGKVSALEEKYEELLTGMKEKSNTAGEKVIIFHEAFAYIAERAGLEIAYTVELEGDTALSATDIANVIKLVNTENIRYLFSEQQYGDKITDRIEDETDAEVFIIDTGVTGDGSKDSYLKAMEGNLLILKEAFQ